MILAPMMDPIVSLGLGIAIGDKQLILRASGLIVMAIVISVGVSALMSALLSIAFIDSQIMSRTNPNLLDLIVAIAAGIIAAFAHCRYKLVSSVAGLACAVALVIPLCVTGIGLNQSEFITVRFSNVLVPSLTHKMVSGSFLLFIINLIGITGAASFVFLIQRYGSFRKSWLFGGVWLAMVLIISSPLATQLRDITVQNNIVSNFKEFKNQTLSELSIAKGDPKFWSTATISYINTELNKDHLTVDLVVEGQTIGNTQEILTRAYQNLRHEIEKEGDYTVDARISFIPVSTFTFDSGSLTKN